MAQITTGEWELLLLSPQDPQDMQHSLYMFHPTLPGLLLELANVSANIVAFDGKHGPTPGARASLPGLLWLVLSSADCPPQRSCLSQAATLPMCS